MQTSTRRSISYPSADRSDRPDIAAFFANLIPALDADTPSSQGTLAARPASPAYARQIYWATDAAKLYYWDGSSWQNPVGAPLTLTGTDATPLSFNLTNPTAGKTLTLRLTNGGLFSVDFAGVINSIILAASTGEVDIPLLKSGAAPMRVHRHPYNDDRHIEEGAVSIGGGGTSSITFTDAYASAPRVIPGEAGGGAAFPSAIGTTGFTLNNGGTAQVCTWLAIGVD